MKCRSSYRPVGTAVCAGLLGILVLSVGAFAIEPKDSSSYLGQREFFKPELYISSSHQTLEEVLHVLPNRSAWEGFLEVRENAGQSAVKAFIDPRSGAATNLIGAFPLLPGDGVGNAVGLGELSAQLGRSVQVVDAQVVTDAVLGFVNDHQALLAIDNTQLGTARTDQITANLWQISIPQTYKGIRVRDARLAGSISHGNLVVLGTEVWGNVRGLDPNPSLTAADALVAGFTYAGGRSVMDEIVRQPKLEILPTAPQQHQLGEGFGGPVGAGYGHRLAWTYVFRRTPDDEAWEVMVDAHSGEVLAFQDVNHYVSQQITGGVYPLTNTEICPNAATCGILQSGWPMPFADTGLASPNNFTNSAGIFDHTGGTATTTLTGRYVDIVDNCGAVSNSSSGSINLAGINGDHDCVAVGSLGNTSSSRSAFYEVNKLAEQARGWLPSNLWLQNRLTTNVNLNNTCNAFYTSLGGTINFYRSGGGCRNTGEIAGVFDHEWGHALDDNDTAGSLSNSSEGYADIVAIYRLQTSCLGHGFFWTLNKGCGNTADGTGFNQNEAQTGAAHCDLDCSGVRDADWDKHADHTPDTALGFVCNSCLASSGPCGRQVHCAAAPSRQAAWDLVARDLRGAPFNYDSNTAFMVGNKVFYQGSGNIGLWHSCTCGSSSSGCGATNAYIQWITADDDNGNLNDGTPHMTAIFNAFDRHGIACATPSPQNSGCAAGPSAAATLTGTPASNQASLSWNSVPGATRYWVLRTEGHAGCDFGKALIAETTGTSYIDTQVANGRDYSYNVVAAGTSSACYGLASNCATVTPGGAPVPDFTLSCSPSSLTLPQGGSGASTCTVGSQAGFNSAVNLSCVGQPAGVTCGFAPNPATPPANGTTPSALTLNVSGSQAAGTFNFQVRGTSGALTHDSPFSLTVQAVCAPKGASCTVNSQCCSNKCSGKTGAKTCK
ncbi:MAG TPA: endopeptidase [Thermoanaerobaculia bacterium]|nr:endopeptidase [Thermoanaerobaculia bacterium]